MYDGLSLLFFLGIGIIMILVMRAIGAWMLRIDEVISELRKINEKLDK